MSLDKIQQLVGSLVKSIGDQERIATPVLAAKLVKATEAYPSDKTIGAMSRVVGKLASNNTLFISRADLKQLYSKLHTRNTKFAELFQDEIGKVTELKGATTMERDEALSVSPYAVGDQVLANALQSAFDKQLPVKMYSQPLADQAMRSVATTLDAWNLRPTSLGVSDGNDKFLVIKADYETPKGVTSFYVPVEVENNKLSEASVFMGNSGPQELNHTNLKGYLTSFAGTKLAVNGTAILGVLTAAVTEGHEVSDAEIALTRLNATRQGKAEFFQGQIVGQKMAEASKKDVALPKSDEFMSFEKKFASPLGIAEFKLGSNVVNAAREHVAREIRGFGYKNPQITVNGSDDNSIQLSVSLNDGRLAFTVPVKVAGGKISSPAVLLCNGAVGAFSKEGLNALVVNNESDYKAAATASTQYGLKPSEVLGNLRQALADGNLASAEDALNVLANSGDAKAYATGFQIYMGGLSTKTATASAEVVCSKMIKNSTSEHPICSHTGLPVHKVYQDKEGNCRPLYRRGMDETYEAAVFNNSKIFG
jgi:hypothetical protein